MLILYLEYETVLGMSSLITASRLPRLALHFPNLESRPETS